MKQHHHETALPWRDREFVTIADAAAILARSRTFVEREIASGRLDARRVGGTGPIGVTARSLQELIEQAEPVRPTVFALAPNPVLKLVVNNS